MNEEPELTEGEIAMAGLFIALIATVVWIIVKIYT